MKTAAATKNMTLQKAGEADKTAIRTLLETVSLPRESVDSGLTTFYIAEENGSLVGIAGFEFYGEEALLRSVAVPPKLQNKGIGDRLVESMIAMARNQQIRRIVLLTETAKKFFKKKGFKVVDRASIDNELIKRSSEFTVACPISAVCMVLRL